MSIGLLLLHAFPLDATMWQPQVASLGEEFPVVNLDLPGFGGASPAGEMMTMDAAADHAATALRAAGIDRAVVCGLSMGGYVALAMWRRHRDLVAGLVFANTRAGADDDAGKERRRALARRLREEGNTFLANEPPPLLSTSAPEDLRALIREMISRQPAASIAAASEGMAQRPDSTGDLPGITVPCLVITSTGDTLIPPDATRSMAEQIPGARLAVIEGAGHLSNLEAPAEFNRIVRDWLASIPALSR